MDPSRHRGADPKLQVELQVVLSLYPVIIQRGTQTLLVKTYLRWLADERNPNWDLLTFTQNWYNYNRSLRSVKK